MLGMFSNVRRWIGPSASGAEAVANAAADSSSFADSGTDAGARRARPAVLRVLLRMVLRDVQLRAGMSKEWLDLEVVEAASAMASGAPGLQARLVLRFWAPRLPDCAAQLERLFMERLCEVDAEAPAWFQGLSWRVEPRPGQFLTELPASWAWVAVDVAGMQPVRH